MHRILRAIRLGSERAKRTGCSTVLSTTTNFCGCVAELFLFCLPFGGVHIEPVPPHTRGLANIYVHRKRMYPFKILVLDRIHTAHLATRGDIPANTSPDPQEENVWNNMREFINDKTEFIFYNTLIYRQTKIFPKQIGGIQISNVMPGRGGR